MSSRQTVELNLHWKTALGGDPAWAAESFNDAAWVEVDLPHNWDSYHGYHQVSHGNLHGECWYRTTFLAPAASAGRHAFATFEGAGSYAEVFVGGVSVGSHSGGRTSFTVELSRHMHWGEANTIAVHIRHPAGIDDLPWVCGGCWGTPNTEGSQPFGIFRPVRLEYTADVIVEPFGVGVSTATIGDSHATIALVSELKNYAQTARPFILTQSAFDASGVHVASQTTTGELGAGDTATVRGVMHIDHPRLWSLEDPHLYRLVSEVADDVGGADATTTRFGVRTIEWLRDDDPAEKPTIDPAKIDEMPSAANNRFTQRTIGDGKRPVHIDPCGVAVELPDFTSRRTSIAVTTTLSNTDDIPHRVVLDSFVQNHDRTKFIARLSQTLDLAPNEQRTVRQQAQPVNMPDLWSREAPYLHAIVSTVRSKDRWEGIWDQTRTTFAIAEIDGLANRGDPIVRPEPSLSRAQFLLNGQPVFINGTAEYEHLLGRDHAFSDELITARIDQIQAAGFNAFREAHHPHNLRYIAECDARGILYWPQMGAHIWFDTDGFRENFRALLREFVKERRNSPSVIMWGIQNESILPRRFTEELAGIVRELDPTAGGERPTTTCNGGEGGDWNIPQNWSGTYGGTSNAYDLELAECKLVGEYGQYRVSGLHTDANPEALQNLGAQTPEEIFTYCLENKIRLGERIRERVFGHFQWLFASHANPGRETIYCTDGTGNGAVGVVNNKGLLTAWGEPVDAFHMYRSNYTPASLSPMIYISSHTWRDRFAGTEQVGDISVYSNCEEVELFNDVGSVSLGTQSRGPAGTHFLFRGVRPSCNVLYAEGRVGGVTVARDAIVLDGLPPAPHVELLYGERVPDTRPEPGREYLYRVNCAGSEYIDACGTVWTGDRVAGDDSWGVQTWAHAFDDVNPELGSRGWAHGIVRGTADPGLYETFRYGDGTLSYRFPVPDGDYSIDLYFAEPWYGVGGGLDCKGWRVFDVAVCGTTVLAGLDIWAEAGCLTALKKTVRSTATGGMLVVGFPSTPSYPAVISAIAVHRSA
ncbi:malectin domain-containing carbohydrate-binding protein [Rathayibacter soli]|uniref:malectin domain-containing carbohydrate-binding protein n=1 Tax=Rathayibacter soli TaxID=3144168 RepID=UPI0027E3DE71|nr:malectin domain-containing carbohydrate-binding protein [Glaciibacter superstes]